MFFKTFPAVRLSYAKSICAIKDPITLQTLITQGLPLSEWFLVVPLFVTSLFSLRPLSL